MQVLVQDSPTAHPPTHPPTTVRRALGHSIPCLSSPVCTPLAIPSHPPHIIAGRERTARFLPSPSHPTCPGALVPPPPDHPILHALPSQDDELLGYNIPRGSWIIVHIQVGFSCRRTARI